MNKVFSRFKQKSREPKQETVNTWLKLVGTGFDPKAYKEFDKIELEELVKLNHWLMLQKTTMYEFSKGIMATAFQRGQNYVRDLILQKLYEASK